MLRTHNVTMGDRGRLVVPAGVRERLQIDAGTPLVLVEDDDGVVILTRAQAKRRVRASLAGQASLVDRLLDERRHEAAIEDGA